MPVYVQLGWPIFAALGLSSAVFIFFRSLCQHALDLWHYGMHYDTVIFRLLHGWVAGWMAGWLDA